MLRLPLIFAYRSRSKKNLMLCLTHVFLFVPIQQQLLGWEVMQAHSKM